MKPNTTAKEISRILVVALVLLMAWQASLNAQSTEVTILTENNLAGTRGSEQPFYFNLVGDNHQLELTAAITMPGRVNFVLTEAGNSNYSNIPVQYIGSHGELVIPDVPAGDYKVVVFGVTAYSGFSFTLTEVIKPTNVVLFLHGFQGTPSSWNKIVKKVSNKTQMVVKAPIIYGGTIQGDVATAIPGTYKQADGVLSDCNYFLYRLSFGAYDTASGRLNVLGNPATEPASGDFETFDTLGLEVQQAVAAILRAHPSSRIVLVAHSRGGLAARAFLQGVDSPEKSSISGLVTLGTPHNGSYFGRLGLYLSSHPKSVDPETWRLVRILRHADQVDAYRPTVSDLATGGEAMTMLNAGVVNLPTSNMRYCNYVYIGRAFGDFPFALGNIFHGSDSIPGHVSNTAKKAMIGKMPFGQIGGDGVVDPSSQRMDLLPGLPANISITTTINPNGLFHTNEHNQSRDILNALETVRGWYLVP